MNFIVSYPRSGQHLVVSILEHLTSKLNLDFSYCDYYNCCNTTPCKHSSIFQKNHDFWLDPFDTKFDLNKIEKISENKYLTLYRRDPIIQLEAYYRGWIKLENLENPDLNLVYNYDQLVHFMIHNLDYYKNFIDKWIRDERSNILSIEYYDLIDNPNYYSKKIMKHFYDIDIECDIKDEILEVMDYNKYSSLGKIEVKNKIDDELYYKLKKELNIE